MADPRDPQALAGFDQHLDELCEEEGVELTPQERQNIFQMSLQGGFNDQATIAAFEEIVDFDDDGEPDIEFGTDPRVDDLIAEREAEAQPQRDFAADLTSDLAALEKDLGRKLTNREKVGIAHNARAQVERDGTFYADDALEDFHRDQGTKPDKRDWNDDDWTEHMAERLRDLNPEQPDPNRVLDFHDDDVEWMSRRLHGEEFDVLEEAQEWSE